MSLTLLFTQRMSVALRLSRSFGPHDLNVFDWLCTVWKYIYFKRLRPLVDRTHWLAIVIEFLIVNTRHTSNISSDN